jgi:hypothetical protein
VNKQKKKKGSIVALPITLTSVNPDAPGNSKEKGWHQPPGLGSRRSKAAPRMPSHVFIPEPEVDLINFGFKQP